MQIMGFVCDDMTCVKSCTVAAVIDSGEGLGFVRAELFMRTFYLHSILLYEPYA